MPRYDVYPWPPPDYVVQSETDALYAPIAKGVTNGDSHNHAGGDGAQIAYGDLSGTPTLYNQTVEDEGTPVTQRSTINFTGAGVSVADTGGKTTVTISGGSGSGDVVGPASSVDSEIALFSGTGGKTIKRATNTGMLKASSGVIATATALTDYMPAPTLVATLASDQATGANTTPVTLTGLVFTYEANSVYRIWAMGRVSPAAATTGCGFQFDVSSAVTEISVQFFHQLASTGTLSGGHSIADDASVGVSSGLPGTSTYPATVFGLIRTGANTGTAQLRFRSETTAVITCKAGFTLVVEKIA